MKAMSWLTVSSTLKKEKKSFIVCVHVCICVSGQRSATSLNRYCAVIPILLGVVLCRVDVSFSSVVTHTALRSLVLPHMV